jgi:hypothetical protein
MRRKISIPASKPRNPVVHALVLLGLGRSVRHIKTKRPHALERKDLDQRVREIGEW